MGKTGTFGDYGASALIGAIPTSDRGTVYFAILNHGVPVREARTRQDRFLRALLARLNSLPWNYQPDLRPAVARAQAQLLDERRTDKTCDPVNCTARLNCVALASVTTAAPCQSRRRHRRCVSRRALVAHARDGAGPVRSLSVSGALHALGKPHARVSTGRRPARRAPGALGLPAAAPRRTLATHLLRAVRASRQRAADIANSISQPAATGPRTSSMSYRARGVMPHQRPIEVSVQTTGPGADTAAGARLTCVRHLPIDAAALELRLALNCAAVIESTDGSLSYWASHHPRPQPDFHDAAGFCVALSGARSGPAPSRRGT